MRTLLLSTFVSCALLADAVVMAGPPIYVARPVSGSVSLDQVSHAAWDRLLRRYVDDDGFVNYSAWHASSSDRKALQDYLMSLSSADPRQGSRDAALAFWINAYNSLTVHGILREYPTTSIRNHTARVVGYNIWKDLQLYVGGRPFSLEMIEHRVLRPMKDPRIHFAIVCASVGCPRLLNEAYTPENVEQQLETNARDFFSRPQNFRYDAASQTFHLSEILKWYGEDFGPDQASMLRAIAKWLPSETARRAALSGRGRVAWQTYNWKLNDQRFRNGVARR